MKRPWKVPFHKNRKIQGCLALSLALHLLVFAVPHRVGVTQFPVQLSPVVKFMKRLPPQRTLARRQRPLQRPLVRRPTLHKRLRWPLSVHPPLPCVSCRRPPAQLSGCRLRPLLIGPCSRCLISRLGTSAHTCALGHWKGRGRVPTRSTWPWS